MHEQESYVLMPFGKVATTDMSKKQKINTSRYNEEELVRVDGVISYIIWTNFC